MKNMEQSLFFSVLMSIYNNDNVEFIKMAIDSILAQTVRPQQIVIVFDGPVTEGIEMAVKNYENCDLEFDVIRLNENKGLGVALNEGLNKCKYPLVARMDSDDISEKNRFEMQLKVFEQDDRVDVVGGDIAEFIGDKKILIGKREVPLSHDKIAYFMKYRCPMNHVTVMMKRKKVLEVGGYRDFPFNEDYDLWIRMYEKKAIFRNIRKILVRVRVGEAMYRRRGGLLYFKSELRIQKALLCKKIISLPLFAYNVAIRFVLQILMPNCVRGIIIQKLARKKTGNFLKNNIKNAFIVVTPYQIFNAINFIENDKEGTKGTSDIYIYDNFKNAYEITERLKTTKIFDHVFFYNKVNEIKPKSISRLRTLIYIIFPKIYFQQVFTKKDYAEFRKKHYEKIIQCSDGLFMNVFHNYVRNTENLLLEDGLYSYHGNMKRDRTNIFYKLSNHLIFKHNLDLNAKKIYVNSSQLCKSDSAEKICQLPVLEKEGGVIKKLEYIFRYAENTKYKQFRFIYLTTPFTEMKGMSEIKNNFFNEKQIIEMLLERNEIFLRIHPRQDEKDYKKYLIDKNNNLWELECLHQISADNVIISFFSTAQFTPKLLFDKEPYIIFLYKIFVNKLKGEELINELKDMYNNKNKIYIPNNVEELKIIMDNLVVGK